MSEIELLLLNNGENCTVYTIQFLDDGRHEFEKFVSKFRENAEFNDVTRKLQLSSARFSSVVPWNAISAVKAG